MSQRLWTALTERFGERVRQHEPLARYTTFGIGGPAELWLTVKTVDELVSAVKLARQFEQPYLILGGGANLLIQDGGLPGLVIQNRANKVAFPEATPPVGSTVTLMVESGTVIPNLARRCAKQGLSGLEWGVGVPGTIGGAVVNNAGAHGRDMAHDLVQAELLLADGRRQWRSVEWFEYAYRQSRLKGQRQGAVVLRAELRLRVAPPTEIESRLNDFNQRRKATQPAGATSGSMFKNPLGDYAGRLIEAVGLKGHRVGQAQISAVHANFFQNLGGATAYEMLTLIETAQKAVHDEFGIDLALEVEVIGDTA